MPQLKEKKKDKKPLVKTFSKPVDVWQLDTVVP